MRAQGPPSGRSSVAAQQPAESLVDDHVARGTQILLFARLRASDRAFWFLGPATYCHHEGERPMAVTWRLAVPLPGDLYAQFAAAVA